MRLGKIVGTAVATIKDPTLVGVKLLIVRMLNEHLEPIGSLKVAADAALNSGIDDIVILIRSRDAAMALETAGAPADLAVVGIVDSITVDETGLSYTLATGQNIVSH